MYTSVKNKTNWEVKRLQERRDITIVTGSDGVKDTSVKVKDLTAKVKAKDLSAKVKVMTKDVTAKVKDC